MTHREALEVVARHRRDCVVVTTMTSVGVWPGLSDTPLDFAYMPSAMGQAPGIGLGLALACPGRGVIVVNGDGCTLMNLGCLVTLAAHPADVYLLDPRQRPVRGDRRPAGRRGGEDRLRADRARRGHRARLPLRRPRRVGGGRGGGAERPRPGRGLAARRGPIRAEDAAPAAADGGAGGAAAGGWGRKRDTPSRAGKPTYIRSNENGRRRARVGGRHSPSRAAGVTCPCAPVAAAARRAELLQGGLDGLRRPSCRRPRPAP